MASKNEKFKQDISLIVNECIDNINAVEAIILYGGYGRDEGAWYVKDGDWMPYNDYDVLVISRQRTPKPVIDSLRKRLALLIGINWVDISVIPAQKLQNMKPSIFNYDLKYGSKVIYGDTAALEEISIDKNVNIPLVEIRTLFLTRLFALIGSPKSAYFESDLEKDEALFFRNQMSKSVLAAVDVQLILSNCYHSSYTERCERLVTLVHQDKNLVDWALNEKLNPTYLPLSKANAKEIYGECSAYFMENMKVGLSRLYGVNVKKAAIFLSHYLTDTDILLRRAYYGLRLNGYFERALKCHALQVNYAFAYLDAPESDIQAREKLLKSFAFNDSEQEKIRKSIADMRLSL